MSNKIKSLKIKEFIKKYNIELIVFTIYIILLCVVSSVHEHWFDEVEAWFISSDASVKTIVTEVTHNEGHPPIWYFILKIVMMFGIECEMGLFVANHIFVLASIFLFLIKAPFKRIYKCIIPFTYFFFYQYGVICRPYCIMMLGFVIAAMFYKERNVKPIRYILGLLLLCSSSAYGIVIAAGICISWIIELLEFGSIEKLKCSLKSLVKGRVFVALLILLVINVGYLYMIIPERNVYAASAGLNESIIVNLLFTLFIFPANAFYLFTYGSNYAFKLSMESFTRVGDLVSGIVFMTIMVLVICYYKKLREFLIPFCMFATFSALVYFYTHHIGIYALFFMYILWCCIEGNDINTKLVEFAKKNIEDKYYSKIKITVNILTVFVLAISTYWSVAASMNDANVSYDIGKKIGEFVEDNELYDYTFLGRWDSGDDELNTNGVSIYCITSQPYLKENIFVNLNMGDDNTRYKQHFILRDKSIYKEWAKSGVPDFIIGEDAAVHDIHKGVYIQDDYTLIQVYKSEMCFKNEIFTTVVPVYIRNDLMDEFPQFEDMGNIDDYQVSL